MGWYVWIQNSIVPYQARLVAVIIKIAGITGEITERSDYSMVLVRPGGSTIPVALEWNCLGWQSMIILLITLVTGLRGRYTLTSKLETLVIGVLGTFLSNLLRMALIVTLAYYINNIAAMIIHDYFAAFVALIWMVFFWWFVYSYVLEEQIPIVRDEDIQVGT